MKEIGFRIYTDPKEFGKISIAGSYTSGSISVILPYPDISGETLETVPGYPYFTME